jgi:hypothetical protein
MLIYNDLMGTNFYTLKGKHIGKRSAAGPYCWDCDITLCKKGEQYVHESNTPPNATLQQIIDDAIESFYNKCPRCNKSPQKEDVKTSSAGRELGFNKDPFKRKTGVGSCSSFSWDVNPSKISKLKYIKSEYGDKLTKDEFLDMLDECPIRFFDSIGKDFS